MWARWTVDAKRRRIGDLIEEGRLPKTGLVRSSGGAKVPEVVRTTAGQCVVCSAEGYILQPTALCADCHKIFLEETAGG